jgi:hypothetical protein
MSTRGDYRTVARERTVATAKAKPPSAAQRNTLAKKELLKTLGATQAQQNAAITALLESANERLTWDTVFHQSVRQTFDELVALAQPKQKPDLGPAPRPKAVSGATGRTPLVRFEPYQLLAEYGPDQLRAVFLRATQRQLREAVDTVQERNPGTKPTSRAQNAAMIDYIVEHVAGPGN